MFTQREIDTHGLSLKAAEELFYSTLNEVRLKKTELEVTFITGVGRIQSRFKELSQEHDLNHYVPMNNRGCIVVEFE